jgi:hypothetical protein
MSKLPSLFLIASVLFFSNYGYNGSTTSAVTLVGGIIKAQNIEVSKKYKRKDCPICLGAGWYISGDKITKVPCGYCEPDKTSNAPICISGTCKAPSLMRK